MTGFLAGQGLEIPGLNRDQYKAQLELSQTIWDGGRSSADKRMAEAEAAEAARTADADLYALEGRVDGLYFGILLLDERIAQTRITIGLLRSDLDKVRSLLRNGAAAQSDADAVEAELLAAGQQLAQVEASRDSYRRMLELFIGRELGDGALRRPEASDAPGRRRTGAPRTAPLRCADRPHFGAGAAGEGGDTAPFRAFRAGILRLSGHGLFR